MYPGECAGEPELRAALEALTARGDFGWKLAEDVAAVSAALERGRAEGLVIDVSLAGHGALDALREQRAHGVTTPALVVMDLGDAEAGLRARELGYCAVLVRESLSPAVLEAALGDLLRLPVLETGPTVPRRSASLAPAMLWKSDAQGQLLACTRRLLAYLGLDESRALGRGWIDAVHPDDHGEWLAAWADWIDSPREDTLDLRLRRSDGAERSVRFTAIPSFDARGRLDGFVGSLFEIDDLIAARDSARAEVDRQETTIRELEELAFAGAHDLQEPLRSLERELGDEVPDLPLALRQVKRMRALLRDLVEFATTAQIKVTAEASDLAQALEWALENLRPTLAEVGAEVKVEALARVHADPIQVARVFQNLVANSIRFRSPAAPVIAVGAVLREREVLVSVRDNGIGIPEAHHEEIFRVFARAHADVAEGSGIGLAISRRIVQRHGGRIWVESQPGTGATFYFTLPRAE